MTCRRVNRTVLSSSMESEEADTESTTVYTPTTSAEETVGESDELSSGTEQPQQPIVVVEDFEDPELDTPKVVITADILREPSGLDPTLSLQVGGAYNLSFDNSTQEITEENVSDEDEKILSKSRGEDEAAEEEEEEEEETFEDLKNSGAGDGYFAYGGYGVAASDSEGEPSASLGYNPGMCDDEDKAGYNMAGYNHEEDQLRGYAVAGEVSDDEGGPGYGVGYGVSFGHSSSDDGEEAAVPENRYGTTAYGVSEEEPNRYGAPAYGIGGDDDGFGDVEGAETTLYAFKEEQPKKATSSNRSRSVPDVKPAIKEDDLSAQSGANWNERFQNILDQEDSYEKFDELCNLAKDFAYCAKTYGRIIISEVQLAENRKTIPPMKIGGVAGGAKYLCQGILFKFCRDTIITPPGARPVVWMYGGSKPDTHAAMKAAAHDLKGLVTCYSTKINQLHFPLMAIIDYRGYRLVAVSILPISKKTLCYGSADGGHSVYANDPTFNKMMEQMGRMLHMKKHMVAAQVHVHDDPKKKGEPVSLYGPADIEGHKGKDGRFYLIDFARCSPPESTAVSKNQNKRAIFFQLLRPEFLRLYGKNLSCDTYSGFDPSAKHRQQLQEAVEYLHTALIPGMATKIQEKFISRDESDMSNFRLIEELHRSGLNVRHLGKIRAKINQSQALQYIMNEIVSRTLKNMLNRTLRKINLEEGVPLLQPYKKAVVDFLNMIVEAEGTTGTTVANLGSNSPAKPPSDSQFRLRRSSNTDLDTEGSEADEAEPAGPTAVVSRFWCDPTSPDCIKHNLLLNFPGALSEQEMEPTFDLRYQFNGQEMLQRLFDLVALRISSRALEEIQGVEVIVPGNMNFFRSDILDLEERVKDLNVIAEAEANTLLQDALQYKGSNPDVLWKMVNRSLERAVSSMPSSFELLQKWGEALCVQARFQGTKNADSFYDRAAQKLRQALTINPEHVPSLMLLGQVYLEHGCLYIYGSIHQVMLLSSAQKFLRKAFLFDASCVEKVLAEADQLFNSAVSSQMSAEFVNQPEQWRAKQFNKLVRAKTVYEAISGCQLKLRRTQRAEYLYKLASALIMIIAFARSNSSSVLALLWQTAHLLDSALYRLPYMYMADTNNIFFFSEVEADRFLYVRGYRARGRHLQPLFTPSRTAAPGGRKSSTSAMESSTSKNILKQMSNALKGSDMDANQERSAARQDRASARLDRASSKQEKGSLKLPGSKRKLPSILPKGSLRESNELTPVGSPVSSSPSTSDGWMAATVQKKADNSRHTGAQYGPVLKAADISRPSPLWLRQTKEGRAGNMASWNQQMEVTCMLIPDSSRCKIIGKNTAIVLEYAQDQFVLTEVDIEVFTQNEISGLDYKSPSRIEVYSSTERPHLEERIENGLRVLRPCEEMHVKVLSVEISGEETESLRTFKLPHKVYGRFLTVSIHKRDENDAVFKHIGFRGHHNDYFDPQTEIADDNHDSAEYHDYKGHELFISDNLTVAAQQALTFQKKYALFKQVVQSASREQVAVMIRLCEFSPYVRALFEAHLEQLGTFEAAGERYNYHDMDFKASPYVNDFVLNVLSDNCVALTKLHLYGCKQFTDDGLRAVLHKCQNLAVLDLRGCRQLGDATIVNVATACEAFGRLRALRLWAQASAVLERASNTHLKRLGCLTYLDLTANANLVDKTLILLARSCRKLQKLNISYCTQVTDKSVIMCGQYLHGTLRALIANGCDKITDKGLQALYGKTCCKRLRELQVGSFTSEFRAKYSPLPPVAENAPTALSDDAMRGLLAKLGGNMTHLNFKKNTGLSDATICDVVSTCTKLTYLDFSYIHKAASSVLACALTTPRIAMVNLKHLHMGHTRANNSILHNIASQNLQLDCVTLDCCHQLTEEGLMHSVTLLKNTSTLSLSGIRAVSEKLISHLILNMAKLRVLNVSNCSEVSERYIKQIQRSTPSLRLYFQPSSKCCRPLCELE